MKPIFQPTKKDRNFFYVLLFSIIFNANGLKAQPTTWTTTGIGGGGAMYCPSINPLNTNEIYVGCDMTELFHTTNQGTSWEQLDFLKMQGGIFSNVQFTRDAGIRYCINHAAKDNVARIRPFKTDDNGGTWYPLIVPNLVESAGVVRLFADYDSPSRVIVTDYNQLFFSVNGGADFVRIYQTPLTTQGNHIAGVFFDGQNIYICCETGIYYSTNGGTTWAWMLTTGFAQSDERILSFTAARVGTATKFMCLTAHRVWPGIRAGSTYWASMRGIYAMSNANGTWQTQMPAIDMARDFLVELGMSSNDTSTVYGFGGNPSLYPIVMKSVNSGAWTHVFKTTNNQNIATGWSGYVGDANWDYGSAPQGFQVCPSNPNVVMTTDLGFMHLTTDGGTTWKQCYVNPADQNPLGANTPKKRQYRSNGIENTTVWDVYWHSPTKLLAGFTDIGGIQSRDGGSSWQFNPFYENTVYRTIKAPNGKVYAATSDIHDLYSSTRIYNDPIDGGGGKVYVTTDGGTTYSVLKNFGHPVVWIEADPNNPSVMYASVVHSSTTIGGIYKTSDLQNGTAATWTKMVQPTRANGHAFNIQVLQNGDLLASFSAHKPDNATLFQATSGVFYFDAASQTWSDRSHNNMRFWTKDVIIDPADATQSTWYACTFQGWGDYAMQGTGGLYRTRDKGLTWARISDEFRVNSVTIHPTQTNIAYYTTETHGLWYSTNINVPTPTFTQVSNYSFAHAMRVFVNPYQKQDIWITSVGNGLKHGIDANVLVLPLELLDFQGFAEKNRNRLTWTFADTKDLDVVEIEKSKDGSAFTPLSKTATTTSSKISPTFNEMDETPFDLTYYRLKMKELDGQISFSKIISVKRNDADFSKIKVYPNPVNDVLTIENAEEQDIEVVNVLGQTVFKEKNIHQSSFNIYYLKNGIYFLKMGGEVIRFVKN